MNKGDEAGTAGVGLGVRCAGLLMILLLLCSCAPDQKAQEELRREIKELKQEVKALGEKLDKLEGGQQALLTQLKAAPPPPEGMASPPQALPPGPFQPPALPAPLTVTQLLAKQDQYLGAQVTVKGEVGPVLVHHKSLLLKSPQGMVEVFFGKLPDPKQVQRLTSTPLSQQLTVTGVVGLPPRTKAGAAKLHITAEAIDF